ncbi:hypothetical protein E2C01_097468 [Portunus trituberculatus]|uniref:Uncharacterized protein n=1 Tax=Portunus trituberculatus TaxID=210409 RepID=A0A5B7KA04_PORTR|nr:hypothetical protein [Portunus trituberculatus]
MVHSRGPSHSGEARPGATLARVNPNFLYCHIQTWRDWDLPPSAPRPELREAEDNFKIMKYS